MKASPDAFVVLVPNQFAAQAHDYIATTHAESWQEDLSLEAGGDAELRVQLPEVEIEIAIDPPIPDLPDFAASALEPFGGTDLVLLQNHDQIWRLVASGPFAAWPLIRVVSTLIDAGASAAFLPGTHRIHSPRAVRRFAMNPTADALANFYVAAFDEQDWMRTRGLTAFHLPEVETQIVDGHNAAYFRLMDLAAAMIARGRAFEDGAEISMGPRTHRIVAGPNSPLQDEVEVNGVHGVITLR